jgi:hypothetical protein
MYLLDADNLIKLARCVGKWRVSNAYGKWHSTCLKQARGLFHDTLAKLHVDVVKGIPDLGPAYKNLQRSTAKSSGLDQYSRELHHPCPLNLWAVISQVSNGTQTGIVVSANLETGGQMK